MSSDLLQNSLQKSRGLKEVGITLPNNAHPNYNFTTLEAAPNDVTPSHMACTEEAHTQIPVK